MAKRAGPSISVKMILTSTLLVLLTVVGFGVLNVLNVRNVYDDPTLVPRTPVDQLGATP